MFFACDILSMDVKQIVYACRGFKPFQPDIPGEDGQVCRHRGVSPVAAQSQAGAGVLKLRRDKKLLPDQGDAYIRLGKMPWRVLRYSDRLPVASYS